MKLEPPHGVPPSIRHKGKWFDFDRMSGTGEPIYQRKEGKDQEERIHIILTREKVCAS